MEDCIKSKDVKYIDRNYRVEIHRDEYCDMGWEDLGDNLGTIYSADRRWNPDGNHRIEEILTEDEKVDTENYICVPIYMYEHSGMTIRASEHNSFSCPWDSGCAGVIAVSKEKVIKEYGELTEETINKAKDCMIGEIHTLDLVYQGEVYGFIVYHINDDGEEEEINSCWGFIYEWNQLDEIIADGEAEAIADAKQWYRENGIQLRIPFPDKDNE